VKIVHRGRETSLTNRRKGAAGEELGGDSGVRTLIDTVNSILVCCTSLSQARDFNHSGGRKQTGGNRGGEPVNLERKGEDSGTAARPKSSWGSGKICEFRYV